MLQGNWAWVLQLQYASQQQNRSHRNEKPSHSGELDSSPPVAATRQSLSAAIPWPSTAKNKTEVKTKKKKKKD